MEAKIFRVAIIQRRMTHYRIPFFEDLRFKLSAMGIELVVAYGEGTAWEKLKLDEEHLSWGQRLRTTYYLNGRVCMQPLGEVVKDIDLLIVTLENKLVCNLWHQFGRNDYKVGLWGHGANLQGDANSFRERFKRVVARRADWWFGYTKMNVPILSSAGFPSERVTIVDNSVDTKSLEDMYELSCSRAINTRSRYQVSGDKIAVFVGSLYRDKRIKFLLDSAIKIKAALPEFELLIIGGGDQKILVEQFCRENKWVHFLGVLKGQEKVDAMCMAKVMLNPGLVGLNILDSFACRVPMITTDCGIHSPEIAYLENGFNGYMVENSLETYASMVVRLLNDSDEIDSLKLGCKMSAEKYTVENMSEKFATGIASCLEAPRYRDIAGRHYV